jgi:predicted TIM-barrel fold metal-dependent hydrolase
VGFVDSDSHVLETDETWDHLDPAERHLRPRLFRFALPEAEGVAPPTFWAVGDTFGRKLPGDGNFKGNANVFDPGSAQVSDPARRLADLDALGIDVQVLISTFFIGVELDNPLVEAALTRSYNRWMAGLVADAGGRLRWTLRPPLRMLDRAVAELTYGAAHGAVGIHVRGIEHGMFLSDPYFWPVYEKAEELGLAVIVHLGTASRRVDGLPIGSALAGPATLMAHTHTLMAGFHAVLASDLHERFPALRWGFVEGGATWVPVVLHQHARLRASGDDFLRIAPITADELVARNLFVACESDEDLGYLSALVGPDVLVTGTDYGHNDLGSELGAHTAICDRTDLASEVAAKIVDTNGRALYGIAGDFRPAPAPAATRPVAPPHVRGARTADGRPLVVATRV